MFLKVETEMTRTSPVQALSPKVLLLCMEPIPLILTQILELREITVLDVTLETNESYKSHEVEKQVHTPSAIRR